MSKEFLNKIKLRFRSSLTILIIFQIALATVLFILPGNDASLPKAQDGILDLTEWNEEHSEPFKLDGQWEFYWERHLEYEDFQRNPDLRPDLYVDAPNEWNGYSVDGRTLSGDGYGTYKLTVLVKEQGKYWSLRISPIATAYRVYVDDRLLASGGQAGETKEEFQVWGKPETVEFTTTGQTFDLIVQVSNFGYAKGGMNRPLLLGTPETVNQFNQGLVGKDFFLMGSLVIVAFSSISMYVMNREEKVNLYFGLVCFVFLCRIPITSSYYLYELFPSATIQFTEWINYTTFHLDILFYALMIREFFPELFSRRMSRLLIVVTGIIVCLLIVLPLSVYSKFYLLSDAIGLAALAYPYYVIIVAAFRRLKYSWLVFFGNGLLLTFVVLDIVNTELNRQEMGFFSNYGIIVFTFIYSFILARRFSLSFIESKALSRQLLQIDKLKDEFLANTSHELKTPLQGIISISESLIDGVEGKLTEKQINNLDMVASSGRRLTQLINDILDVSKLKHGDLQLSRKHVHVQPLVEFVLQMCKQMYLHKPIEWKSSIPANLPPVLADENRLVQILYNIVGNAAKYTEQGEVKITGTVKSDKVEIRISDTGKGIPADQLEYIFQPFTQVESSMTRSHGGLGLGLSITKYLIELHGGQIDVQSVPGEGSTFAVVLPASVNVGEDVLSSPSYEIPIANQTNDFGALTVVQSGEHILLVDDDQAILYAAFNMLKSEGYSLTAVTNGKEALQVIRNNPDIRLVILDVMMPGISGYEVCRMVRETHPFVELPILMVTAKHQPADLVLGFEAGANDFLVKPFEATEFKARVRTLIEWNQSLLRAFQSEMAFLQAQIKPHFIYNTLNTISYFCTRDGMKAKQLLNDFADYLRSHFDFKNMDKLILLERELHIVTSYLNIEKERFGSRLDVQIEVDDEALAAKIPPFIMQPLVENAILHGVLKKVEGGRVHLSAKRKDQHIHIRVRDTGIGMTAEQAARLLSGKQDSGVGFRNVQERMKILYGREVTIHSVEGKGTEVTLTIPAEVAMNDDPSNDRG